MAGPAQRGDWRCGMSSPRDLAIWVVLRDDLARDLHEIFCDGRHDDSDGPCWTAWRDEADELMPRVTEFMARAWAEGYLDAGCYFRRGQPTDGPLYRHNPYRD